MSTTSLCWGAAGSRSATLQALLVSAWTPSQPPLPTTANQEPVGEAASFAPFYYTK